MTTILEDRDAFTCPTCHGDKGARCEVGRIGGPDPQLAWCECLDCNGTGEAQCTSCLRRAVHVLSGWDAWCEEVFLKTASTEALQFFHEHMKTRTPDQQRAWEAQEIFCCLDCLLREQAACEAYFAELLADPSHAWMIYQHADGTISNLPGGAVVLLPR